MRTTSNPTIPAAQSALTMSAPACAHSDASAQDKFVDAPFFADGVLARARATQARLEAANFAKVNEPKVFARAVREVYEKQELVQIIKKSLAELGKIKGHPVVYCFDSMDLTLTEDGFRDRGGDAIGKALSLGEYKTAAAARQQLDTLLVRLADSPDSMVEFSSRSKRCPDDSSSSVEIQTNPPPAKAKRKGRIMRSLGRLPIARRLFR